MFTAPVLLVHGFASSFERNWRQPGWVDLLKDAGREVIGVDLLGHGGAARPHDPAAYASLEDDVEALLPEASAVDAIGFSLGARVLLTVAARGPDRFHRIVVGGVGANLFRADDADPMARAVEGSAEASDPMARAFARVAADGVNDPKALAACLRRPTRPMSPEELGRVSCPVLVVLGSRDFAGPADPLMAALPDGRLVMLSGVDHLGTPMHMRFIDAALEFLGAVPGA